MAQTELQPPILPRAVIEHIRRYEFGIGALLEGDGRVVVENMVRKYRNLLATVAEDLNSKASHFILELVQNADDNRYSISVAPSLSFCLEPAQLIVTNNEVGFTAENVKALCSAGESSKKNKSGYIGEKGIGFKSVFKVTDAPEIHSNGYHFQFNRSDPNDLLGYVVPNWIEPRAPTTIDATTVVLPSKPGQEFQSELLCDLDATLLLFLAQLRRIEITADGTQVQYLRDDMGSKTELITIQTSINEAKSRTSRTYLRTEFVVDMSMIEEPKREGVLTRSIVVAFPLTTEGAADPNLTSPTYAFLPIREFGFSFCIQADFVLISSREGIHEDLAWNLRLRDAIAPAFVAAVERFKTEPALAKSFLKFLPSDHEIVDPFFKLVVNQIIEALKHSECIPVEGGSWRKPSDVLLASTAIRELFPSVDAIALFGADYPAPGLLATDGTLKRLSCRILQVSDVLEVFGKHRAWFELKDIEWKSRFFEYIAKSTSRSIYIKTMVALPCLPTTCGKMLVPEEQVVFFPLSAKQKYGFEDELTILDDELYELAIELAPEIKDLFDELGVRRDDPFELIQSHILKRHTPEGIAAAKNLALIGHVRYVRDNLDSYLQKARETQTEESALKMLRDGLYLGSKREGDGPWYFERPETLYLSKEYQPEFSIEGLLGEKIPQGKLLSEKYIVKTFANVDKPLAAIELMRWREFFVKIGVHEAPKVMLLGSGNVECSEELVALLGAEDQSIRRSTLECLDRNWSSYADLTTYLVKVSRYSNKLQPTRFIERLRATVAPSKRRISAPLEHAYHDRAEVRELLGGNIVLVNAAIGDERFLKACGITYKVDAAACLKRLRQIRSAGGSTKDQIRKIYRHLEALWSVEHQIIEAAFRGEALIALGRGETITWVTTQNACWRATGVRYLDARSPALSTQYVDHSTFFTKLLHVPFELALDRWIDGLSELSLVEPASERESVALAIYRRLSRELGSLAASKGTVPVAPWLSRFKTESLFLVRDGLSVTSSPAVFFNDAPEYAQLFDGVPGISFLAIPQEQLPAVVNLIQNTGVPLLSAAMKVVVATGVEGERNEVLTRKIKDMFLCIARVVYGQSHDRFEVALKENLFGALRDLEVLTVPRLALNVSLGGSVRQTTGPVALRNHQLLLCANAPSHLDYVALEVRKLLRLPTILSDIISRILISPTIQDAEAYLLLRNFSHLPPEEAAALAKVITPTLPETESREATLDVAAKAVTAPRPHSDQPATAGDNPWVKPLGWNPKSISTGTALSTSLSEFATPSTSLPTPTEPLASATPMLSGLSSADAASHHPANTGVALTNGDGVSTPRTSQDSPAASLVDVLASNVPFENDETHRTLENKAPGTLAPIRIGMGAGTHIGRNVRRLGKHKTARSSKGRLLSYAEPSGSNAPVVSPEESSELAKHRAAVEQAAIKHFLKVAAGQWRDVLVMPPNNPGFDIKAVSLDGQEEFIEIKGQGGAWTEEGIALTPTELIKAHSARHRYWLCVVEYAQDENRHQLFLVNDPFGLTSQFRFDKGWKAVAGAIVTQPQKPEQGMFITVNGEGKGHIVKVKGTGLFTKLHIEFEHGKQVFSKVFNPTTMTLSYK
jgi:hypothetical protein